VVGDHDDDQRTRRSGEVRSPVSDPVVFRGPNAPGSEKREIEGWALNISTGGLRAILDEAVPADACFDVVVGEAEPRPARVVWVRKERDGAIVGVAFEDVADASAPPDED
jgi:hypothetical protein